MNETVEILRAARALIDTPEKWAKRYYAYDAHGFTVDPESPGACRFCAVGALYRAGNTLRVSESDAEQALGKAVPAEFAAECRKSGNHPVICFNDKVAEHPDVLALYDRAIELAEAKS